MSSSACVTVAPSASAIAWWPKHTPSNGMLARIAACTTLIEMPADAGFPGPGEMSTAS